MALKILVTGASGFVGKALVTELTSHKDSKFSVSVALRKPQYFTGCTSFKVSDITKKTDWSEALAKQDVVIHTAARAHIMNDEVTESLAEYRKVNVDGTLNLARQAAAAGVNRFIFISSIKVNGEQTSKNHFFTEEDVSAPEDAYGLSKFEAEQGLQKLASDTGMDVVIIRPPLVYGPGVKGNFANMIKLVEKGFPLPLGAVHNKRSMLAINNLVSFIKVCITHPAAANQLFLIADSEDISTTELLNKIAEAYKRPSRLIPVPVFWMTFFAKLIGKQNITDRLFGNLQIESTKAQQLLGWMPVTSMEQQLNKMAELDNRSATQKN